MTGGYDSNALIQGSDGLLYGTTNLGGSAGLGTIYQLNPVTKKVRFLYSFTTLAVAFPSTPLLQANDGNFYGCTSDGTDGDAIFQMTPAGVVTTFYTFSSVGPLIQGTDGNFYLGAASSGKGGVYQITPAGVATILHTFGQGTDGDGVTGALVQGPNGNLYGMSSGGGTAGHGIIFELSTDGSSYTILHNFTDGSVRHDGQNPEHGLVVGADNNLYGTTRSGGSAGLGTVFRISP